LAKQAIILSNGREFPSKTVARDHFKAILHANTDGAEILKPAHHSHLTALLERYDNTVTADHASKIGSGIASFERRRNIGAGYSTPGFWVVRTDGSETDFSFYTAIEGRPKRQMQEFADACRAAVAGDLAEAKRRYFRSYRDEYGCVACEVTGKLITAGEAHLDHAYPAFGHLVVMFRATQGWHEDIPEGVLTPPRDRQTTTQFSDPQIAERFRAFHQNAALLRILDRGANLAQSAKRRVPKVRRPVALG
jgi:hypothetical protein